MSNPIPHGPPNQLAVIMAHHERKWIEEFERHVKKIISSIPKSTLGDGAYLDIINQGISDWIIPSSLQRDVDMIIWLALKDLFEPPRVRIRYDRTQLRKNGYSTGVIEVK